MADYSSRTKLVLTAIKTCIDTINTSNYDNVPELNTYLYQREFSEDDETRKILCGYDPATGVYGDRISAWFISNSKLNDLGKSVGQTGQNDFIYTVDLLGYLTANLDLTPSSEETFDAICELVADRIAVDIRVNLPASSFIETFVQFNKGYSNLDVNSGTIVHRAEGSFTVNLWHTRGSVLI